MLSPSHLILVFLVALLVFGPEKLPELARTLSKAMGEFHRLTGDFQETLQREMRQLEQETSKPAPSYSDDFHESSPDALPEGVSGGEEILPEADPNPQAASAFEGLRYTDASYVASVAQPSDENSADKAYETAMPDESPQSAPTAQTPPVRDSAPEAGNSSPEDASPVAGGAEKPVNDHPTAA